MAKVYYSVSNGGDGSAYPQFFETEELAAWHQDHLYEGWGEPCTGSLEVEGDNISFPGAQNAEGYYVDLLLGYDSEEEAKEFKNKFFPNGQPEFVVLILNDNYYGVKVKGTDKVVYKAFQHPGNTTEEGRAKLAQNLA